MIKRILYLSLSTGILISAGLIIAYMIFLGFNIGLLLFSVIIILYLIEIMTVSISLFLSKGEKLYFPEGIYTIFYKKIKHESLGYFWCKFNNKGLENDTLSVYKQGILSMTEVYACKVDDNIETLKSNILTGLENNILNKQETNKNLLKKWDGNLTNPTNKNNIGYK